MSEKIQDWLNSAIHNTNHLETVSERMIDFQGFKRGLYKQNKELVIQSIKNFYDYILHDHQEYGAPHVLIDASIARTHFFHGTIHGVLLHDYQSSAHTYSLLIVYHNKIDNMIDPHTALDLTIEIIDSYFHFLSIIGNLQLGEFSEKVIALIDQNIDKPIRPQELAEILNLNSDYLGRKVKEETGKTLTQLIYTRKIDLAQFYLRNTHLSVKQIADNLGFESSSYFGKVFKKYTDFSPIEFKNTAQL